jgi:1,4-dihydroxy-2-naphthoyl-CoA synthase
MTTTPTTAEAFLQQIVTSNSAAATNASSSVSFEIAPNHPGIGLIKLHNGRRHNALSPRMMLDLRDIVERLEREPSAISAVVLTGESTPKGSFCTGLGAFWLSTRFYARFVGCQSAFVDA